jgi:tetratricopeptide (TPR) repeat protein
VDVQGAAAVAPWVRKFGVSFPVAVDRADVLGGAFGLNAIPVTYLVDEVGIIRVIGGGPSPEFLAKIEQVLAEPPGTARGKPTSVDSAAGVEELRTRTTGNPADGQVRLALAQALIREGLTDEAIVECSVAAVLQPREAMVHFAWGLALLARNDRAAALERFRQARDLAPGNWRIRKQIWALENPDRFYGQDGIDWEWQKSQIEAERQAGIGPTR